MRASSYLGLSVVGLVVTGCGTRPTPSEPGPPAVAVDAAPPTAPWTPTSLTPPGLRLPHDFEPRAARVHLSLDPALPTFVGQIEFDGEFTAPTPVLWLHAERLTGVTATLQRPGEAAPMPLVVAETPQRGVIALHGAAPLTAGPATVRLSYQGPLDATETYGAFRQQVGADWYAFTQFEPTGARLAMPCLDEPDRKLPWTLTLDVPTGMIASSNAPIVSDGASSGGAGFHQVQFAATPPLPAYLVAFAVGPFDVVPAGLGRGGAPLQILTPRGRAADGTVAAELVPELLAQAEAFLGPYPFAKLDSVVIPTTVGFGAMENPGLITYGEKYLLMPADAPATRKRLLAQYMAHELAHMWFGDLVTPAYWDDLWLNESFATWLTDRFVAAAYPGWVYPDDDTAARDDALQADRLRSTRTVRQPIGDDGDITDAFDEITYEKGAAVLRMIERWLGVDVMQRAVRAFLDRHAYGNATAADFLAAATEVSGKDVRRVMGTFLDQRGAPELTVEVTCNDRAAALRYAVAPYLPLGADATVAAGEPAAAWQVPTCVVFGTDGNRQEACGVTSGSPGTFVLSLQLPGGQCPTWAYANAGGAGYYRLAGQAHLAGALTTAWPFLTAAERLTLVQDVRAQVARGTIDVAVLIGALPRLVASGTDAALDEVVDIIRELEPQLTVDARLRRWVMRLVGPLARRLGWTAPSAAYRDAAADGIRARVMPLVAELGGDRTARRTALRLADDPARIPAAVRRGVLRVAIVAEPARFDAMLATWRAATDKGLREDLLAALASVPEPTRLAQALALTLEPALDARDTVDILDAAMDDERSRPAAEAFVQANFDALFARLPRDYGTVAAGWLTASCDGAKVAPMRAFIEARLPSLPGGRRAIDQAMETMTGCVAERADRAAGLAAWQRTLR